MSETQRLHSNSFTNTITSVTIDQITTTAFSYRVSPNCYLTFPLESMPNRANPILSNTLELIFLALLNVVTNDRIVIGN